MIKKEKIFNQKNLTEMENVYKLKSPVFFFDLRLNQYWFCFTFFDTAITQTSQHALLCFVGL
jgi:hypothetical protein